MAARERDLWIIGGVIVVVGAGATVVSFGLKKEARDAGPVIARVENLINAVDGRPPGTLSWTSVTRGMGLVDRHTVRAKAASNARVRYENGSGIVVEENTTVTIRKEAGDEPLTQIEVGVLRTVVVVEKTAATPAARVALPDGRILRLSATRKDSDVGRAKTLAKIVVAAGKEPVMQAFTDLAVTVERATETGVGRARDEKVAVVLKPFDAVALGEKGATAPLERPPTPAIGSVRLVGSGDSRQLVIEIANPAAGGRYRVEWARESDFRVPQHFEADQAAFQVPIEATGRWYVRAMGVGGSGVQSIPSTARIVDVPADGNAETLRVETLTPDDAGAWEADAGAAAGLDAGAGVDAGRGVGADLDAGLSADAGAHDGGATVPMAVASVGTPDAGTGTALQPEVVCAKTKGGTDITTRRGKDRRGKCAQQGDTIAATTASEVAAPGVGSVSMSPGSRLKIERLSEEALSVSFERGVIEVRSGREHGVAVTGAVGINVRPGGSAIASVRPGEFTYVEGVRGNTKVDLGGGVETLRSGEAVYWVRGGGARRLFPYRRVGAPLKTGRNLELVVPAGRATILSQWSCAADPADMTIRVGGRTVLQTINKNCLFSFESGSYGSHRVTAVARGGGTTLFDGIVTVSRDKLAELKPVPKAFHVDDEVARTDVFFPNLIPHLKFKWKPANAAKKYYFSISADPDFKRRLFDEEVADTAYTVDSGRLKEGVYYWRVAWGGGDDEKRGPFKLVFKFESKTPSLWIKSPKTHTLIRGGTGQAVPFSTSGVAIAGSKLRINGESVSLDEHGRFDITLKLPVGENWVTYDVRDPYGREQRFLRRVDVR